MKTGRAETWCRLTLVLVCTAVLGLGCGVAGRDSAPGGLAPQHQASGFTLHVMDESFIQGGSAQDVSLNVAERGSGVVASVKVAGAKHLKALFFDVSYDPAKWGPMSCETTEALGQAEDVLSLSVLKEAGKVYSGQILAHPQRHGGFSGDATLARVTFTRGRAPAVRAVSSVPTNEGARTRLAWNNATHTLSWRYYNVGDYDQNAEVNLADMVPLSVHFKESGGPFDPANLQSVIDGDNNGEINLADLVPIAADFHNNVSGYNVYHSLDPADYPSANDEAPDPAKRFDAVPTVPLPTGTATERQLLTYVVSAPVADDYYWVRPTDMTDEGTPSVLLWTSGGAQGDWCMTGHDAQRTGQSRFIGPQTNHLKWALDLGGDVRANPVIAADGTIYVGTFHTDEPSAFFAVNPNGTVKWSFETEDRIFGAAVAADGTVYAASGTISPGVAEGKLYAVDPDGTPKWTLTTGALTSPLIDPSGVVHVASQGVAENLLYAVNPDGTVRWAPEFTKRLDTPALSAGGTTYVGCLDQNLYAVNSYGSQEWAFAPGSCSMPVVSSDGTIYAAFDGSLFAVAPDGAGKWPYSVGFQAYDAAVGTDGTVYVVGDADGLHAVSPYGMRKWTYVTGWRMRSQPAIGADRTVYVASNDPAPSGDDDDCALLAVNRDGTLKWSYSYNSHFSGMYAPAIGDDGTLYVGSDDDHLYAFGP